ncbi:hypothetical protein OS914_15105 [Arthrobacter sp. H14-L1]|nr:hypothetical protein [Arthrobacter sp. H14-L1]
MLALKTPVYGAGKITITNAMHNAIHAPLLAPETALDTAETAHREIPVRLPLGELVPGQEVRGTQVKLSTFGIRMSAFNTVMTLAREILTNAGYARASQEADALASAALYASGGIDTTAPGYLTIRLDPLPIASVSKAIAELCEHLISTEIRYAGTDLILRYTVKNREPANKN